MSFVNNRMIPLRDRIVGRDCFAGEQILTLKCLAFQK